jgi:hydroxymethylpyrimidine pyrophosphatase-like HAD family hydrolase
MRFRVLASDYDGTLAESGHVSEAAWAAIRRLKISGRQIVLVTGRLLVDLQAICPHLDLFDRVVAENGALIYAPSCRESRILGEPPSPELVSRLVELGVTPLSVGHVIVATTRENEGVVFDVIREFGLDVQIIYNQDSAMILPNGVNKASGLAVALNDLGRTPSSTVAVGDAENDLAMMFFSELGVAVGSAEIEIKNQADFVVPGAAGTSVIELIDRLVSDDLKSLSEGSRTRTPRGKAIEQV